MNDRNRAHIRIASELLADAFPKGRANMLERLFAALHAGHQFSEQDALKALDAAFFGATMPDVMRKGNPWPKSRNLDSERKPRKKVARGQ